MGWPKPPIQGFRRRRNRPKFKSFEFYRRNLYEPEVITFDELFARTEWQVTLAEIEHQV